MTNNNILPKVSVMVPVYNAEDYIEECLDSILNQDYKNIEIVVSDDCSSDNTQEILIKKYRHHKNIILFLNKKNLGVTLNCNQALEATSGDFISLFAGDDVMKPLKIETQLNFMLQNPDVVLSYHPVEVFDSATGKILYVSNQSKREALNSFEDILVKAGIPGACSIMIRRNALPIGLYDIRLQIVSDWLFQLEISMKGRVAQITKTLARYRKHEKGESQKSYELLNESLYALDLLIEKYPNKNLDKLVRVAKQLYVSGEVIRQLKKNKMLAFDLSKKALFYRFRSLKNLALFFIAFLNKYIPGVNYGINFLIVNYKYKLKRYLA